MPGWLSDRVNRRALYAAVTVLAGAWPFVFFTAIQGRSWGVFIICVVVGLAIHSFLYGPQAAFIAEQFCPRLRYTGSSLGYTIAGGFGGALAPLIFTLLLQKTGSWVGPALYLVAAAALTLVGVAIGRDPQHEEDERYLALARTTRPVDSDSEKGP